MEPGDWISIVALVVSSGFAFWSAWSARKSKYAEDRATKQVQALMDIAAAMKQHSVAAAEKQQVKAQETAVEELAPWLIRRVGKSRWDLVNVTLTPKYGVTITGPAILSQHADKATAMIPGRGSINIRGAFRSMQTTDDLVVTWHREQDLSDEPLTWLGRLVD